MKTNTMILAAVAAVVIAAGAGAYYITSTAQTASAGPKVQEFKIETWDFGYNGPTGGPTLNVKAGQTVRVTLVSKGGVEHEFRLSNNKETFLSDVEKAVATLQSQGMKDQDVIEKADAFKAARRASGMKIVKTEGQLDWDTDVGIGETKTVEFTIDTRGTYWYLCGELDATFPQTHAHRGMAGQIVVTP